MISPVDTDVRFHTIAIGSERGRLLSERVEHDGFRYVAAVVAPLADFERDMGQLRRSLMLGIVSALVLAAIAGLVVGRRALRPLAEMAEQARTITEANPVERLRAPNPRDELGTFASSFNGLLDRLASVLQAQRQFMADASHELRTPVSIVRSAAQVTLARPLRWDGEYRESLTIVAEQAERLTRLVDAMFLLSRAEDGTFATLAPPDDVQADLGGLAAAVLGWPEGAANAGSASNPSESAPVAGIAST